MTALATYTIPKVDMQVSGTLASSPGIPLRADYTYSATQAAAFAGRPLSGAALLTVNLVKPGDVWGDRLN